jgi:hypothetical protein
VAAVSFELGTVWSEVAGGAASTVYAVMFTAIFCVMGVVAAMFAVTVSSEDWYSSTNGREWVRTAVVGR